ncbi:Kelch repeat-containing protein [Brevundimonas sp.]|uniref:Kelch repeat-containing protein n=1 Tax=Brevundimonas sp. TaxID=1871086 RepID=UPI0035AED2A6
MTQIDRRALIASVTALSLAPNVARAQAATGPQWTTLSPLPWAVQEIYAAVWDGRIVTAGGLRRRGQETQIEHRVGLYDPRGNRWSELPRLPEPRHHPMVMVADGRLNVVGGYGRSDAGEWTNTTTAWVLEDDRWAPTSPLPSPQAEAVGVGIDGRLHLVTGRSPADGANGQWNDQADTDRHLVRIDGRWETARPAPAARNSAAAAELDGAIWVAGGRTVSGGGTGRLDRYDPVADRWDTLAPIPRSFASNSQVGGGLAMVAIAGRLVAFGGEWFAPRAAGGGGGVFAETWIYSADGDVWTPGPDMLTPRHGLAAAAIDGTVYAIAGGAVVSGGGAVGTVESLSLTAFY